MPIPKVYTPPGSRGGRESLTYFCRSLTSLCDRDTYQQVAVTWCSSLLHSRSLVNTCFHVFFKKRSSLWSLLIFHPLYLFEKFLFGCLIIFRVHIHTVRSSTGHGSVAVEVVVSRYCSGENGWNSLATGAVVVDWREKRWAVCFAGKPREYQRIEAMWL